MYPILADDYNDENHNGIKLSVPISKFNKNNGKEPDFLLNHLYKLPRDDLGLLMHSLKKYRQIMNSWHMVFVLNQITYWIKGRYN